MKILLSAYACEPYRGSEAEIGWAIALELAKKHQVWVLTRSNNKHVHSEFFSSTKNIKPSNLNFIYYDVPKWASFYKNGKKRFQFYYYHWQLCSYFVCNKAIKEHNIDIVHHITGGMDFFPSGLSFLRTPFVLGPIGGEDTHPKILNRLPIKDRVKEYKRIVQRYILRNFEPFTWFTRKRADHIITYSTENAVTAQKYYRSYSGTMSHGIQTGLLLDDRYNQEIDFKRGDTFTILYAGKLIPWKGGRFVVDAFIKLCRKDNVNARLIIVGDGPLEADLKSIIVKNGLDDKVEFKGWLAMQDLINLMPKCDLFLYPTYHHGLANVCLQAMAMGLPMICLQGDGIETVLEKGGGIAVPIDSYDEIGENLACAIYKLYLNEELRLEMAKTARSNVIRDFNYSVLASNIMNVYEETLKASER